MVRLPREAAAGRRELVIERPAVAALAAVGLMSIGCVESPLAPERLPLTSVPPDLAGITFEAEGRSTAPYTLLELRQTDGFSGFVAVNSSGLSVWYFRTVGSPFGTARRANGNFVFLDSEDGVKEVTPEGDVVSQVPQEARPGRWIHHDVTATPDNTILFIAEAARPWPDTLVTGEALWEWTPETGALAERWNSFDHLDPEVDRGKRSRASDWLHANSVSVGPRGSILVSLHFLNQVISIAPDFQTLDWRLGGVGATIDVADPFSGQHTAAELFPGRVLVFDNGFERVDERYSRAAEYQLGADAAELVWEWRPERDNWARVISSARRLPQGNTLVSFGTRSDSVLGTTGPIEVYEVTVDGDVVWHLTVGGDVASMYRATPLFEF